MAVARHPVACIAPPAPAIISASRARVGERDGQRGAPTASRCQPVGKADPLARRRRGHRRTSLHKKEIASATQRPRQNTSATTRQWIKSTIPPSRKSQRESTPATRRRLWPTKRNANRHSKVRVGTTHRSIAAMASRGCAGMSANSARGGINDYWYPHQSFSSSSRRPG